jgi:putative hydrolase of the HAD superfamily
MSQLIPAEVRAMFFDAVGTLIHPDPPAPDVYAEVGRRHGSHLDEATIATRFRAAFQHEEEIDRTAGWRTNEHREVLRWRRIVHEVLHDANDADACFEALFAHFSHPGSWRVDPDAAGILRELSERGFVMGLASNYDNRLRTVLAGLPELTCFTQVVISAEIGWRKPAIQFFANLADRTGLEPSQILLVGDDWMNDYQGARATGMHAILVDREDWHSPACRVGRLTDLLAQ